MSLQAANVDYIKVPAQEHHYKEYVELDLEKDWNISLEALKIHFGSPATRLRYRNPETESWQLVNCKEGRIEISIADVGG